MAKTDNSKWLIMSITFIILSIIFGVVIIQNKRIESSDTLSNYSIQIDSLTNELTVYKELTKAYGHQIEALNFQNFKDEGKVDSLQFIVDSLAADNFKYQYKLGRIQGYVDIVNKNSTQSKYLKGWITRALNE